MYIYKRIRDLREDTDKTQAELAKILNVGTTTYRRWEIGEREIPTHVLIELAKLYNVSLDYILGLTNEPQTNWNIKNQVNISGGKNKIKFE